MTEFLTRLIVDVIVNAGCRWLRRKYERRVAEKRLARYVPLP